MLRLGVLRHRDFRYLFLGQSASAIGDQVVIVALALYVTQHYGSATDLGLVLMAQTLPLVGLLLFGGVFADRRGGRTRVPIMIGADLLRFALHAVLAGLIFAGGASIPAMIVIEALFGAARAFFQPAYAGLVPQTAPEVLIQEARALTQSTQNVAVLVGPALGTLLVLGFGAGVAFTLDALTFVLSAALLTQVRPRERGQRTPERERGQRTPEREWGQRTPESERGQRTPGRERRERAAATTWQDLREGWREVRSRPWVWVTIAAFTGALLCAYAPWYALAPVIARDHYGGVGLFGVLESLTGAGAVIGSLVALRWRPRRPMYAGLALMFMWPVMNGAFALGAPEAMMAVIAVVAGLSFSLFGIWWETALARNIPPRALSRVSAYDWMGSLALLPVGFALSGPLAGATSPQLVLGLGAAVTVALLAGGLLPRSTRELSRSDSAEDLAGEFGEEAGREAEVANVDALVGAVHQWRGLQ